MTVTCEACGTANRDKAMFCRGCLARLPAFVATPVDVSKPEAGSPTLRKRGFRLAQVASDERRIGGNAWRYALLAAAALLVLGFVWLALRPAASRPESQAAQGPSATARPVDAILDPSGSLTRGSLGPGESLIEPASSGDSGPSVRSAPQPSAAETLPVKPAPISPAESIPESVPPAPSAEAGRRAVAPPARVGPLDPRQGCEHLFFAFAARCEANHCQQSTYARHPRCEIVRKQRLIEEGRRNAMPTS